MENGAASSYNLTRNEPYFHCRSSGAGNTAMGIIITASASLRRGGFSFFAGQSGYIRRIYNVYTNGSQTMGTATTTPIAIQSRPCKRSPNAGSASFHKGVFAYEHHRSPDSISGSSDHPRVSVEGRSLARGV